MGVSGSGKNPTPGWKIDSDMNRKRCPTNEEAKRLLDPFGYDVDGVLKARRYSMNVVLGAPFPNALAHCSQAQLVFELTESRITAAEFYSNAQCSARDISGRYEKECFAT
jgi:hypothetical protein